MLGDGKYSLYSKKKILRLWNVPTKNGNLCVCEICKYLVPVMLHHHIITFSSHCSTVLLE